MFPFGAAPPGSAQPQSAFYGGFPGINLLSGHSPPPFSPFLFPRVMVYYKMNWCGKAAGPVDNVILIGMPGSGKSTVGVLLAKALGYDFLDVDLVLQRREGALLQDILDRRGVQAFLDAEERAVLSLDCRRAVISPGGSAVCRERAARHLRALGPVVYLDVPLEELTRRIHNLSTRGIAMEPGQTLADVLAFREPLYRQYAHLAVPCPPGQELAQTVRLVHAALTESGMLR